MNKCILAVIFFNVFQLVASAGQLLSVPSIKRESYKKKEEFKLVQDINERVHCAKCGPALHSNYRVDLSDPKLHIFFPDEVALWTNSKRCENKCVFNALITVLRSLTEKRFTLFTRKLPNDGKKYIFFDGEKKEFTFKVAGRAITQTGCLVITQNGRIIYCISKEEAKNALKKLAEQAQK